MNTTDTLNESAKAAARYQVELTAKKEAAEIHPRLECPGSKSMNVSSREKRNAPFLEP